MIDTRVVGQELQDQVLDAARKGRERVTSTVKTVAATAQHIRPQLTNLPMPNLTMPTLPTPAQLRERADKLPKPHQLMSGVQELAEHARSVQRLVIEQVRTVAVPLAHQAAARLAKIGAQPAQPQTATRVSGVHVSSTMPAKDNTTKADATTSQHKAEHATTSQHKAEHATTSQHKAKPRAKSTTK